MGERLITYWNSPSGSICSNDVIGLYGILRSMGKGTGGERYMWKEGSPELAKIAEAVKEHDAKAEAQKSSADPHQR